MAALNFDFCCMKHKTSDLTKSTVAMALSLSYSAERKHIESSQKNNFNHKEFFDCEIMQLWYEFEMF